MKKILLMFLTFVIATIIMAGCSATEAVPQNTESVPSEETSAVSETVDASERLEVPTDRTFDGYEFTIYSYDHSSSRIEHNSEGLNGDVINDSVYERNRSVEEMFDIHIKAILNPWDNNVTRESVRKTVAAGDDAYDLLTGNTYNFTALSSENMFAKIESLKYIDVTKPWWNYSSYKELSVGENAYLLMGDLSLSNYGNMPAILFNKKYIADYGFENPYTYLDNNTWTSDKLIEITKDFYIDVDGNGNADETDLYGFYAAQSSVYDIVYNWMNITEKNENNYPEIVFYNERTGTMFDKMRTFLLESDGVWCPGGWTDIEYFSNGYSVFIYSVLNKTTDLRDMASDYGMLPVPKYDENQEEYTSNSGGLLVAVSKTASDLERSGMIIEALSYFGKKLVYPAYVENAIMIKGTRDAEAQKSVEIILNSVKYDFGYAFSGFDGYGYAMLKYINEAAGFSSLYEKISSSATLELTQFADLIINQE